MVNPWLTIPLADYEGHMALPAVGQARMLAEEFRSLLDAHGPASVALVGCAGGNGFEAAAKAGVVRLVGIDINPGYIAHARDRYTRQIPGLELHCADIQTDMPSLGTVDLIYAALVFEYVDHSAAMKVLARLCRPDGLLAVVLQLPQQGADAVTPSPFESLKELGSVMRLVPPEDLKRSACSAGFACRSQNEILLPSGKQFALMLFCRSTEGSVGVVATELCR